MLYADKRNLEVNLQVALLSIRDKELVFYQQNLMAMGTQAALIAGFAYNGIIMTAFPPDANLFSKGAFLCTAIAAMSLELMTVGGTMYASIYGPNLALRGPDGSMHRAVDGMLVEYKLAFILFASGLVLFVISTCFFSMVQFSWALTIPMSAIIAYFAHDLWVYIASIFDRFGLREIVTGKFEYDKSEPQGSGAEAGAHGAAGCSATAGESQSAPTAPSLPRPKARRMY